MTPGLCLSLLAISLLSLSCNDDKNRVPDINRLYTDAAMHHDSESLPVIVIPGVLGSNLIHKDTKQSAWGAFHGDYLSPSTPEGLQALALRPQKNIELRDYNTPLISDGALKSFEYKLLGMTLEAKGYLHIMQILGVGGFRDETLYPLTPEYSDKHFTCFQFGYDWRLSSAENAARLHEFILEKQAYLKKEYKTQYGIEKKDVKFNIVSHSMGGLIARYYARYGNQQLPVEGTPKLNWAGAKNIKNIFIVSTPNNGSTISLLELIEGRKVSHKWAKKLIGFSIDDYPPELIGTFPSMYELLPRKRHHALVDKKWNQLDPLSLELWKEQKWGLAGADQELLKLITSEGKSNKEREEIALNHLEKCLHNAQQFHKAIDHPAKTKPEHLKIILYVGDAFHTVAQLKLDRELGTLTPSVYKPGDETVLRSSVLANQNLANDNPKLNTPIPFNHVHFIFKKHIAMTEDTAFADNLLFELLER